ncbi:MAG: GIY-YIG nuclease family protein [Xanthobacteraceae bacterium]
MNARFFVYILTNEPRGVLYVGVTNNLPRRVWEHKTKIVPGFTRTYGLTKLVYFEEHASILEARERERALKRWRRAWKFKLVEELNPDWRDFADELVLL